MALQMLAVIASAMTGHRSDDSLNDLPDLWCKRRCREAEAERYADEAMPDSKSHVADEEYNRYAEDQDERKCDCHM